MKNNKSMIVLQKALLVFLVALLLSNLYVLIMHVAFKKDFPKVFGFAQTFVISGSMEPAIEVGDLLILHEQKRYEVNDIVTFDWGNSFVTHRIIEIDDTQAVTKGDSNNVADKPILLSMIEGKVVLRIPKIGGLILFLKTPFGILITVLLAIFLLEMPHIFER